MTREEAIRMLSTRDAHGMLCGYTSGYEEALDMAVEVLGQEQPEIIRCKNCRHDSDCEIQYSAQAGSEFFCGAAEKVVMKND